MRLNLAILLFSLSWIFAPLGLDVPAVPAADFRSGDTVVIEGDEVIDDDLFIVARTIVINGTINGDLIAAGRSIVHHGTVLGSAALAGQKIRIHGDVNGSVYGAGYSMTVHDGVEISRNVLFRGFALTTRPGSAVGGDIYASANQVVHEGAVAGDLNVDANALEINGQVSGDILGQVEAKEVLSWADVLPVINELDNRSFFVRDFAGFMPADLDTTFPGIIIGSAARIDGEVLALQTEDPSLSAAGRLSISLGKFLGLMFFAAILLRTAPRLAPEAAAVLRQQPWRSLGWGALIYLLLFPLALIGGAALVLLLTFIVGLVSLAQFGGMVLGLAGSILLLALFAFLFIAYILTWIIAGHLIGRRFLARADQDESRRRTQFLFVALGVAILLILRVIPVVGLIVAFLVATFGLGALYLYWRQRRQPAAAEKPLPKPVAAA